LIQHTYEAAQQCRRADQVIVATDCEEIVRAVQDFGGQARLTRVDHTSGTDRIAEVVAEMPDCEIVVNVQGDEPEMDPAVIDAVIDRLRDHPAAAVATAACPILDPSLIHDPSCVKVVCDHHGRALYFSRSPLPYPRNWDDRWLSETAPCFWQHLGIYAYRRDFLLGFSQLPASPAEQIESLEQLRVLQAGFQIVVAQTRRHSKGIDTAADYAAFVHRVAGH
jgi:3-deoxy-manno-octulosonate cytidylyltransferase (CMP-KDO synthetase)